MALETKDLELIERVIYKMAAVIALIYSVQSRREKQNATASANEAAARKAVQDAADEHQRFLEKYVDTGITKNAGNQLVAVAVASESRSINHAVGAALITRFKADHVQLTDSFFKPELVTDGLFNSVFNRSSDLFNKLELAKSLDGLLLAKAGRSVFDKRRVWTASSPPTMHLEIVTLPVDRTEKARHGRFTANGTGFSPADARMQAEERIIHQINANTNMALSQFSTAH